VLVQFEYPYNIITLSRTPHLGLLMKIKKTIWLFMIATYCYCVLKFAFEQKF